jgi:hypothetical protein
MTLQTETSQVSLFLKFRSALELFPVKPIRALWCDVSLVTQGFAGTTSGSFESLSLEGRHA